MIVKKQQKRSRAEAIFAFGETELNYAFRYGASIHETVADYFEIAPARKFVAQRDWKKFQLGALVSMLGLTAMAVQIAFTGSPVLAALWLTPGLAVLALFVLRQNHFRVIEASGEPVWILDDRNSHDILSEIELRRRKRLAEIYGPLNLNNEPRLEIGKIEWLVVESVLSREEADRQIAHVAAWGTEKDAAAGIATAPAQMFSQEALAI